MDAMPASETFASPSVRSTSYAFNIEIQPAVDADALRSPYKKTSADIAPQSTLGC
jgi:hypothetical protein